MSDAREATDASVIAALRAEVERLRGLMEFDQDFAVNREVVSALRAEVEELKRQLGLANQALDGMRERDSRHRAEVERLTRERDEAKVVAMQALQRSEPAAGAEVPRPDLRRHAPGCASITSKTCVYLRDGTKVTVARDGRLRVEQQARIVALSEEER